MIKNNWTLDSPDLSSDEYQDKLSPKNKLSPKKHRRKIRFVIILLLSTILLILAY